MSLKQLVLSTAEKPEHAPIFNNAAQAWNHAFYWRSLSPRGGGVPPLALKTRIASTFGDLEALKEELGTATTTSDPRHLQTTAKFFDLLMRLVPSNTITFLDFAGEVFAIALGDLEIVISQLAPLGLELAGELFPLPLDLILVHENLRASVNRRGIVNGRVMQLELSALLTRSTTALMQGFILVQQTVMPALRVAAVDAGT